MKQELSEEFKDRIRFLEVEINKACSKLSDANKEINFKDEEIRYLKEELCNIKKSIRTRENKSIHIKMTRVIGLRDLEIKLENILNNERIEVKNYSILPLDNSVYCISYSYMDI